MQMSRFKQSDTRISLTGTGSAQETLVSFLLGPPRDLARSGRRRTYAVPTKCQRIISVRWPGIKALEVDVHAARSSSRLFRHI